MNKEGLLDGFPIHLFSSGDGLPTVIVDNPELGRITVTSPLGCDPLIVLSPTKDCAQSTSRLLGANYSGRAQVIQADPRWIPLRDAAAKMIVIQPSPKMVPAEGSPNGHQRPPKLMVELDRVLHPTGSLVELSPLCEPTPPESIRSETERIFYVRPASGTQYFVTKQLNPSPWPFRHVHHGRLRTIRNYGELLISRIGVRKFYNGARIVVRSKGSGQAKGLLEECVGVVSSRGAQKADFGVQAADGGMGLLVKAGKNALLIGGKESSHIVKLPLSAYAIEKMQDHLRTIESVQCQGSPTVTALLPKVAAQGTLHGQPYWAETVMDGVNGTTFRFNPAWRNKMAESATRFIQELHQSNNQPTDINREVFGRLVSPRIATLDIAVKDQSWALNLDSFEDALWETFQGRRIPLVRTHGDFWPANLLVSPTSELTGVLDWDESVAAGWPVVDLIHFIEFQHKWRATWRLGSMVTRRLVPQKLIQREREIYATYFNSLDLPNDLWPGFVALYWLHRVSSRVADELLTPRWCRWNILEPFPCILKSLTSRK